MSRAMNLRSRALVSVALVTAVLVLASGVAGAALTVRIVNTDGDGVSSRSAPSVNARNGYGAPEGATVTANCWTWGDSVGPYSNRLWWLVSYAGRQFYVADRYLTTPNRANEPPAGQPQCGAQPAPVTAPASGPRMATTGGYYDCTNTALAGCASRGTLAAGVGLTMHCWIDDSYATGAYGSNRWLYVTATNGIRGFVHSSRVDGQATVPNCGSHRGVAAGRWAAMQIGETVPNPGEQANNPTMNRWSGWCYVLAWDSHALSHGAHPVSGKGNATNTFFEYQRRGATSTEFRDAAMNIGSIVFWTTGGAGHAAIYVGNGYVVSTQGYESDLLPVARRSMASFGTPAGWVAPANI